MLYCADYPDSPSGITVKLVDSTLTASWKFPKLSRFPVQFILNLTVVNFNESRSLTKVVNRVLSYSFTTADMNPCKLFNLCITASNNVSLSEATCINGRFHRTNFDSENQGVSICVIMQNQMYNINCQYVSTCSVTGCVYILKGDNTPDITDSIQGNETQTQMIDITHYNRVTVYDIYGNLVVNRTLDFNEVELCYPTTG